MRNRSPYRGQRPLGRGVAALTALAFLLAACAQPLEVAQLERQKLQVTAVSKAPYGGAPDLGAVEQKALWQAARATLDSGHRYFKIVERRREARPAGGYGLRLSNGANSYSYVGHDSGEAALAAAAVLLILVTIDLAVYGLTYSDATAQVALVVHVAPLDGPPHAETGLIDAAAVIRHWPDLTVLGLDTGALPQVM